MSGGQPIVKEMGMTRDDFARGLASALQGYDYRVEGDRVVVEAPGQEVTISFEALPPRRLGLSLAMPRARVTIAFGDFAPAGRGAFLQQFDRAFQRGGG